MNPRVRNALPDHETAHTDHLGWRLIDDHLLLPKAEAEGFAVLVTTDKRMQTQQNNAKRRISLVVLSDNSNQSIRAAYQRILEAVESSTVGSYTYIEL
jgi:hypothetical protein